MDNIRIGLDFGTHQTKICVQTTPDEGHGQPNYRFFQFKDQSGKKHYFLPSLVKINADKTLSYGFVSENVAHYKHLHSQQNLNVSLDTKEMAKVLYEKYATEENSKEDISVLEEMLAIRTKKISIKAKAEQSKAQKNIYNPSLTNGNVYRYFKQATFSELDWDKDIKCEILSIWYLSYVIFLLEKEYGQNFSINMGIPTDDIDYEEKKQKAVGILLSAYNLVENVFENNMGLFLKATLDELMNCTECINYSKEAKEEYFINVFPEAYAGLISLTSRGKISEGMSLTADIGGGTTDISFFTINNGKPIIYRYWSIPCGLNYIAENSGFDYVQEDFEKKVNKVTIDVFNSKKKEIIAELESILICQFKETNIDRNNLFNALNNRVIVYNGGGSMYEFLTDEILYFTDVKIINANMWKEENVIDKSQVSDLCQILTTAYGLSLGDSDDEVKLSNLKTIFEGHQKNTDDDNNNYCGKFVDKDLC